MKRSAFTMLELIFVMVVIGILAGIAIPKLGATRDDAEITKGRADVATIRSGIAQLKAKNIMSGNPVRVPPTLGEKDGAIFTDVIQGGIYPETNKRGRWSKETDTTFIYQVGSTKVTFTYDPGPDADGTFTCVRATKYCKELTE